MALLPSIFHELNVWPAFCCYYLEAAKRTEFVQREDKAIHMYEQMVAASAEADVYVRYRKSVAALVRVSILVL